MAKHFTRQEIEEIRMQLAQQGMKDTDFIETDKFTGDDYFVIVQDGKNKKISADTFRSDYNEIAEQDHQTAMTDHQTAESDSAQAGRDHQTAVNDHEIAVADHALVAPDHAQAEADSLRARQDHNIAVADHTIAVEDHNQAVSDSIESAEATTNAITAAALANAKAELVQDKLDTADQDHVRAESDHRTATTDHVIADGDHTAALLDHENHVLDHAQSAEDSRIAGINALQAQNDHTRAESDHNTALNDHTTAQTDHSVAVADHNVATDAAGLANEKASEAENAAGRANTAAAAAEHQVDVKRGYGIQSVTQPVVATTNGGVNTIRVTTEDGKTFDFQVRNGKSSAGFFQTSQALNTAIPSPNAGDYAFVSKAEDGSFPAYIYVCATAGTWSATEAKYDGDSVDLTPYATKEQVSQLGQEVNGGEETQTVSATETKVNFRMPINGNNWTNSSATGFAIDSFAVIAGESYHLVVPKMSNAYTAVYEFGTNLNVSQISSGTLPNPVEKGPVTNAGYDIVIPEGISALYVCYEVASGSPVVTTMVQVPGINELRVNVETVNTRIEELQISVDDKTEQIGNEGKIVNNAILGGTINGRVLPFEIGAVTIDATGWTFTNSNTRARIKQGSPVVCKAGDIISLSDYTNYRMFVGWRIGTSYKYNKNWLSADFTCPESGEYEILLARQSGHEVTISNATDLSQNLSLTQKGEIKRVYDVAIMRRKIRSVAHQGYSETNSQGNNLAEGYVLAAYKGFNYGECDIQFSSDNIPFCCHSSLIDSQRVNAFYDPVAQEYVYFAENTAEQILFHAYIDADHTVSTFEEVLAACKSVGIGLYIDNLSNVTTPEQWNAIFSLVKCYAMIDNIVWLAPSMSVGASILEYYPNAEISIIRDSSESSIAMANALKTPSNKVSISLNSSNVGVSELKTIYGQLNPGVEVFVYTINSVSVYKNYIPYVKSITSDKVSEYML